MGALREKMIAEMRLRNFAPRTQKSYVASMVGLARHYRQFPDQLTQEQIRAYRARRYSFWHRLLEKLAIAAFVIGILVVCPWRFARGEQDSERNDFESLYLPNSLPKVLLN